MLPLPTSGWVLDLLGSLFSRLFLLQALIAHASETGSFDGGDQGLLNTFFDDWATKDIAKHLPFLYNMVATATYTYIPAYK